MGYQWTENIKCGSHHDADIKYAYALETIRQFAQSDIWGRETARLLEGIGPTMMGVKPASLINTRSSECVKLCKKNFDDGSPVAFVIVKAAEEKKQLFFYHKGCLQAVLSDVVNSIFLVHLGYPEYGSAEQYVRVLAHRMRGADFPHEAGLFLGYPIKDVCGFMGARIPYQKTMGWRMYGDTRISEVAYNRYRNARSYIRTVLRSYI